MSELLRFMQSYGRAEQEGTSEVYFYLLTDKSFEDIKQDKNILTDSTRVIDFMKENGRNLHICGVVAKGIKTILWGVRFLRAKYNPKTISWYNKEFNKLVLLNLEG